jgi:hypothetical protein
MVVLALPFTGRWLTQNSPARRVPSHGTDLMGERYAIDFVAVDERGRTASRRDWRTALATEPPERYLAFGRPILAPADGVVARTHDGEADHAGRRSQLALLPYMLGQAGRVNQGADAVAGNSVILALRDGGPYVALAHLRSGSLRVRVGDAVTSGRPLAQCGNSGNSTQPHLHLQVMDSLDFAHARGVPVEFRDFREWPGGAPHPLTRSTGVPAERSVVEAVPGL